MSRIVVTGVGCVGPAGPGTEALAASLRHGRPLGAVESIQTLRGRRREMMVARIPGFDREAYLPPRKLRRMGEASQAWVIACLMARSDAGLHTPAAAAPPPERRGVFMGTGFGCTGVTWDYLRGLLSEGAGTANPYLFSESVANAPAGHSAIELDTRGSAVTLTCADASAAAAIAAGARAIRQGRLDLAYCGGLDMLSEPLLRILAAIGSPCAIGEGAACLVLESQRSARARGARIHAALAGSGAASDPEALPTSWSHDPSVMEAAMRGALAGADSGPPRGVYLHACGDPGADDAEARAVDRVCPDSRRSSPARVVGAFAAAGGLTTVAAALGLPVGAGEPPAAGTALVTASAWGGSAVALVLTRGNPPAIS